MAVSESSVGQYVNASFQDSILYGRALGTTTPLQRRVQKAINKPEDESSNLWILAGIIGGFCFGFGNLLIVKASHFGFYTRELILLGGFLQALVFLIGRTIQVKWTTGNYWNWEKSGFRDPDTGEFRYIAVFAVLLDATIKVSAGYLVIISFKYALYAGVNQGAITTIFALSSIYVAIISWFLFDEKLNKFHILGMLLLLSCTVMIVISKTEHKEFVSVYGHQVQELSTLWPVGFAIMTTIIYSFRTIYIKVFVKKLKFNSFDYITQSYMLSGLVFMPFTIKDMFYYNFDMEIITLGVSSGVLNGIATFLLFYSTSHGFTGPAYALKNIEPIVQAIFGSLFLGAFLNTNQIIAIVFGILGSLTITVGPYLFPDKEAVAKRAKEERVMRKVKKRYSTSRFKYFK